MKRGRDTGVGDENDGQSVFWRAQTGGGVAAPAQHRPRLNGGNSGRTPLTPVTAAVPVVSAFSPPVAPVSCGGPSATATPASASARRRSVVGRRGRAPAARKTASSGGGGGGGGMLVAAGRKRREVGLDDDGDVDTDGHLTPHHPTGVDDATVVHQAMALAQSSADTRPIQASQRARVDSTFDGITASIPDPFVAAELARCQSELSASVARTEALEADVSRFGKENYVLKRAVSIQARQNKEMQQVVQQQQTAIDDMREQLRALERSNYELRVHLAHKDGLSLVQNSCGNVF